MKDGLLEFKDAPMFGRVMRDPDICKGVLERILGFAIDHVEYLDTEHTLDPATHAKGVRLDVFAKSTGRVYDVEMQVASDPTLGRRIRYYQASIDQACLKRGHHYDLLPESFIIFICDFDAFGYGLPTYHFERICLEENRVKLGNDSHWIILNASAWNKDDHSERAGLLEYIHTDTKPMDALTMEIDASVQSVNNDRKWRERAVGFMTVEHSRQAREHGFWRVGRDEGMKEGLEQGEALYAALVDQLLEQKRFDDLKRSAEDPAFRHQLLEEFDIH